MSAGPEKTGCGCIDCQLSAFIDGQSDRPVEQVMMSLIGQVIRVAISRSSSIEEANLHAQKVSQSIVVSTAINAIAAFGVHEATTTPADDKIGPTQGTA